MLLESLKVRNLKSQILWQVVAGATVASFPNFGGRPNRHSICVYGPSRFTFSIGGKALIDTADSAGLTPGKYTITFDEVGSLVGQIDGIAIVVAVAGTVVVETWIENSEVNE